VQVALRATSPAADAPPSLPSPSDRGWRRLRFVLLMGAPGVLANALAIEMPGAVPFLLGNMAFVVLGIRLDWRYALLGALMVTAGFVEPRWTLLALAEAALVGYTGARGPLALAWARIWLPLLVPVLWLTRPESGDPLQWLMGASVILTNGLVALLGARLIAQLTASPRQRRNFPFRDRLAAQLAVATAAPIALLMVLGLQLRFSDNDAEQAMLLDHRALQLAGTVDDFLRPHVRALQLAARVEGLPQETPLAEMRAVYPAFTNLLTTDAQGNVTAMVARRAPSGQLAASERDWFRVPRDTGRPYVGPATRTRGNDGDELQVALGAPMREASGRFLGVVHGTLSLAPLGEALAAARGTLPVHFQVFDGQGGLVASSLEGLPLLARPEPGSLLAMELDAASGLRPPREVAHQRARQASAFGGWEVHALRPLQPVRAEQTAHSLLVALLCLGLILLLTWLASRLAAGFALPLAQLVERVQGVDLRDPSTLHPLQLQGETAEMHELIGSVDAMLDRLGELHAELTEALEAQAGLNRELEGRVARRTAELQAELERSERLAQAKSVFLANMSHELRTPLAAILGYTEQALRRGTPASVWLDTLRTIDRNGRHLLGIVNDVLDAGKIESGQLEVEQAPVSPLAIAEEALALMAPPAKDKQLQLRMEIGWPIPETVLADRLRLQQVLLNLLGNAIKFTEHGHVLLRIAADRAAGSWWYEVEDTGIGISEAQQRRLFERFEQADVSTTRRFGGTGLGLFISHELAQRMQGSIEMDSIEGRGSRFRLRLPLPPAPRWLEQRGRMDDAASGPPPAVPQLGGRVLVAEDVPDLRRLVSSLLRSAGAEVVEVANGREAFERASAEPFDLLLLDMHMPVMDGREATEALRAGGYRGPIVALTADVIAEDVARYRAAGCDTVLGKPVDSRALFALLRRHLPPAAPAPAGADARVQALVAQLGERYRAQLPAEIEALLEARHDATMLVERLHRIKGSAGSFGFPRITELAGGAEHAVRTGDNVEIALQALIDEMRARL
jgi:signal transduction histidine kinase/DNA-binding NarL/FixJ family response regulator